MLRNNEAHKRLHGLGPKDCTWKNKRHAVTSIQVTRSTMDSEQIHIAIPVFDNDSREELSDRIGMMMSLVQDRMDDIVGAMQEAEESEKNSREAHEAEKQKAQASKR